MKKSLEKILRTYSRLGQQTKVVPAPEGAVTFDKMISSYKDNGDIDKLLFYDTQTETVVGVFN